MCCLLTGLFQPANWIDILCIKLISLWQFGSCNGMIALVSAEMKKDFHSSPHKGSQDALLFPSILAIKLHNTIALVYTPATVQVTKSLADLLDLFPAPPLDFQCCKKAVCPLSLQMNSFYKQV
jgi:hypothetical protein